MHGWPEELKEKTISFLKSEFRKRKQNESPRETDVDNNPQLKTFASRVFGFSQSKIPIYEEFSSYLDEIKTPQAFPNIDPFEWWRDNQKRFPTLHKIARKYLGIPATSVPSERLFSDAGNQISTERNRLKPSTVNELLFVKRNIKYVNPFV
jgi:glutaredoxin-related protein